jgi:hypothetical protein
VEYPDSVMGELIRFVAAHEVGHTLGLPHNMKASAAVTVDQLRSDWVCENGTAPTIMDYARYNYVAQPGDDTCYSPKVGPYDKYIINWGYRPIPGADSPEAEIPTLSAWIEEKGDDPLYRFGDPSRSDPSSLTEALGSNAVEASDLGILNLQRIVENLTEWTYEEGEDYSQLEELYGRVLDQWNRYTGHVATNIGGVYWNRKAQGQDGMPYIPVDRNTQRQAMDYLNRQVFATPTWMLDEDILRRIEEAGALDRISAAQAGSLNRVLNVDVMKRLVEQELFAGSDAYGLIEMLDDLREGVWSELSDGEDIDPLRRNVQRAYLNRIAVLMQDDAAWLTDAPGALRAQLLTLQTDLASARAQVSDRATEAHLIDSEDRIRAILELDRLPDPPAAPGGLIPEVLPPGEWVWRPRGGAHQRPPSLTSRRGPGSRRRCLREGIDPRPSVLHGAEDLDLAPLPHGLREGRIHACETVDEVHGPDEGPPGSRSERLPGHHFLHLLRGPIGLAHAKLGNLNQIRPKVRVALEFVVPIQDLSGGDLAGEDRTQDARGCIDVVGDGHSGGPLATEIMDA